MNLFTKNIKEGSGITPPDVLTNALKNNFKGVVNAEWMRQNDGFEAIFYKDGIEHIALFATAGELLEYKMFLPEGFLPEAIRLKLEQKGEIMNSVLINRGNTVFYEVITRNEHHQRFRLLLSNLGQVLEEKQL
jgi:hypothetical protein